MKKTIVVLLSLLICIWFYLHSKKQVIKETVEWVKSYGGTVSYAIPKRYEEQSIVDKFLSKFIDRRVVVLVELDNKEITDLSPLANFKELRWLTVDNCAKIKDYSALHHFKYLESISLPIDSIHPKQQDLLESKYPNCRISYAFEDGLFDLNDDSPTVDFDDFDDFE